MATQTVNTNPQAAATDDLSTFWQKVARQVVIHSAHPYHFLNMTFGTWNGVEGIANALTEDYSDMSDLRGLVRQLCAEHPDNTELHTKATTLKCFE